MKRKFEAIQLNKDNSNIAELHCETCNTTLDSTRNYPSLNDASDRLLSENRKAFYNHNSKYECHDCFSQERFNRDYDAYVTSR